MDENEIEERLKRILTPEFDRTMKQIYASSRELAPDRSPGLRDDLRRKLQKAVDDLFDAFAHYRMSDPMSCCDHCVSPDEVRRLRSTPLRELTHDDLWTIATNIVLTMGDDRDYRYFLPRMIEGLTENALYDSEIVFSRLQGIGFTNWPIGERTALTDYLWAQFNADLSIERSMRGIWAIDTLLCCIGIAALDADPFLSAWASSNDEHAMQNLVWYVSGEVSATDSLHLTNAFWSDGLVHSQILHWLQLPATIALIERAYQQYPLTGEEAVTFEENLRVLKSPGRP